MTIAAGVCIVFVLLKGNIALGAGGAPKRPGLSVPSAPLSIGNATTLGSTKARVALIEYFDFQCPFCARFAKDILPALKAKYIDTGKVMLILRHYPLPNHPLARPAAEAAVCADRQGKSWEVHDLFFRAPKELSESINRVPSSLGLSAAAFSSCLSEVAKGRVDEDLSSAAEVKISSTPAFFVGEIQSDGRVKVQRTVKGARPLADFEKVLDDVVGQQVVANGKR